MMCPTTISYLLTPLQAPAIENLAHFNVLFCYAGNHAVWAISRDRRVWFRNGIHGGGSGDSEALARGVKWVGMVGEMSMISIGPMDQVVAIQEDSKHDRYVNLSVQNFTIKWQSHKVHLNGCYLAGK